LIEVSQIRHRYISSGSMTAGVKPARLAFQLGPCTHFNLARLY